MQIRGGYIGGSNYGTLNSSTVSDKLFAPLFCSSFVLYRVKQICAANDLDGWRSFYRCILILIFKNFSFHAQFIRLNLELGKSAPRKPWLIRTTLTAKHFDFFPGKKKEPHIKKPLNAFMLYMKEMRPQVQAECTLKESAAINQILGRRVRNVSLRIWSKFWITNILSSIFEIFNMSHAFFRVLCLWCQTEFVCSICILVV